MNQPTFGSIVGVARRSWVFDRTRYPSCKRAAAPPRAFCDRCSAHTDAWVSCGGLCRLDLLPSEVDLFCAAPRPLVGPSGSPVRAYVVVGATTDL